jgi:prolipoprotein diacylglyceryltransferase
MRRAGREGLPEKPVALLGILLVPGALLGAKLFFWIFETAPRTLEHALSFKGGLVFYGGIVLSVIFTFFYARQRRLALGKLFDAFTPSLALGIGIGRIGCFLSGCCYGSATTCWSGTVFPPRAHVYRALGRIGTDPDGHAAALTAVPEALRPLVLHNPTRRSYASSSCCRSHHSRIFS